MEVFTDGSCINNGGKYPKACIGIYFGNNDTRNVSKQIIGKQSNNTAELIAIIEVFDILKNEINNNSSVIIYSDSEYSINSFTKWGIEWEKNNWKKKSNGTIKNLLLIQQGFYLLKKYPNVKLSHVKAHTGNNDRLSIGNSMADQLAYNSITQ